MATTTSRADAAAASVGAADEISLDQALRTREPVRLAHGGKELVFGPYYARAAAFVPVSNDVVVVFGCEPDELAGVSDEALRAAGMLAADAVESVSPAKRLADELEELEAVRSAAAVDASGLAEAMRALALIAAESLSCEVAAVYLADGDRVEVVDRGWTLEAPRETVAAALRNVLSDGRFPYCVQDASVVPLPSPLDAEHGIRSSSRTPTRCFTLLCRRLGLRLAQVASAQLGVALTREWCSGEAARLHAEFGTLDTA